VRPRRPARGGVRARPCGGCCPAAIPPSAAPPRRAAPVHAARTCPCGQGVAVARSSRLQGAYTAQDGIRRHRSSHCSECGLGHPAAPHGGCSSLPRTGFMSRGRASRCIYAGPVDAGKLTGAERGRVCRKHNIRNMSVIAHVDHGALPRSPHAVDRSRRRWRVANPRLTASVPKAVLHPWEFARHPGGPSPSAIRVTRAGFPGISMRRLRPPHRHAVRH
jgi:hypothetical protein